MLEFTFKNYDGSFDISIEAKSYVEALANPALADKVVINCDCNYMCKRINHPQVEWDFELTFYKNVHPRTAEYRLAEAKHNTEVFSRRWDASGRDILFAGLELELYHIWNTAVSVVEDYIKEVNK